MLFNVSFETIDELRTFANTFATVRVNGNKSAGETAAGAVVGNAPQSQPATQVQTVVQPHPVAQPQPVAQPVAQTIPTTTHTYTAEDLANAAMPLMDAGKQEDLKQLLSTFGVDSLPALPQHQFGAFAVKLRELGAKI